MIDDLRITTLAERPDLAARLEALKGNWPEFMRHEPVGERFYIDAPQDFPECTLVAYSAARPDKVLARGYTVPIGLAEVSPEALPDSGWDGAIRLGHLTRLAGYKGDALCGLEVVVSPELRKAGLGTRMLQAMLRLTAERGLRHFVAPVRPPGKADEPQVPMSAYAARTDEAGLPADPLLRAHAKLGSRIVGIAPASMTISGSVQDWRAWTGLPFDTSGPVVVPGALTPVFCDVEHEAAVYVEPNVWVHQRI